MSTNAELHYEHSDAAMMAMKEAAPYIGRGFGAMYQKLMQEGALSMREKELIALAIGLAIRCEPCIYSHAKSAVKHGATREQILEMAGVVVTMQGGPAYVYVPKIVEALDALGV